MEAHCAFPTVMVLWFYDPFRCIHLPQFAFRTIYLWCKFATCHPTVHTHPNKENRAEWLAIKGQKTSSEMFEKRHEK